MQHSTLPQLSAQVWLQLQVSERVCHDGFMSKDDLPGMPPVMGPVLDKMVSTRHQL